MPEDEENMRPWDPWARRHRLISPFFGMDDIDEDFERMHRYMDALLRSAMSAPVEECLSSPERKYVYGFTLRMGPDGKPIVQEFGNTRPSRASPELLGIREPLVDINECADIVAITAELPGVEKEDVGLTVNVDSVVIEASRGGLKYYKEISLNEEVEAEKAAATYKNGILDVQIPKKARRKSTGHRVNVE